MPATSSKNLWHGSFAEWGTIAPLDAPDAGEVRVDVIELVHNRVELRDSTDPRRVKPFFRERSSD